MQNYKRGYNFEIRVRDTFRDSGFEAERKAASAPYDIFVMKDGRVVFIVDAKKTGQKDRDYIYVGRETVEKIKNEAEKIGAQPLITYGFYRSPIYVETPPELLGREGKNIRLEEGVKLEGFLDNYGSVP
ncbi:MAG: hypothetical protein ACLFM9_02745 [Candidatus Aenigmatarchaeota archaeon]